MLFDLRSGGRRRTVKTIYTALAVLMAAGLVLFGIGGAVSGGLLDAFTGGGGGGGGGTSALSTQLTAAKKKVAKDPQNAAAWAQMVKLRYSQAAQGDGYNQNTQQFTAKGKAELGQAVAAWNRYTALDSKNPDPQVATLMVNAFVTLGKYDQAFQAQQIVVGAAHPATAAGFYKLAQLAYIAGQSRQGDLAAQKAVSLTSDKTQRQSIKTQLASFKKQAQQAALQQAEKAATSGPASTTGLPGAPPPTG